MPMTKEISLDDSELNVEEVPDPAENRGGYL